MNSVMYKQGMNDAQADCSETNPHLITFMGVKCPAAVKNNPDRNARMWYMTGYQDWIILMRSVTPKPTGEEIVRNMRNGVNK